MVQEPIQASFDSEDFSLGSCCFESDYGWG